MNTVTIDGATYNLDELSDDAKEHLTSLRFVDKEITELNLRLAAMQTARNAYGLELRTILGKVDPIDGDMLAEDDPSDTLTFD